jgi:HB1/ASXL restriction endonuclease-like protein with HTH domain
MATATKKKPASKKQKAKTGKAAVRPKKAKAEGKLSAIDAAAKVLGETSQAMATKELIEAMATKGYWKSPHGLTPQATLYSAILREITAKGKDSRFVKAERGKFALKA